MAGDVGRGVTGVREVSEGAMGDVEETAGAEGISRDVIWFTIELGVGGSGDLGVGDV